MPLYHFRVPDCFSIIAHALTLEKRSGSRGYLCITSRCAWPHPFRARGGFPGNAETACIRHWDSFNPFHCLHSAGVILGIEQSSYTVEEGTELSVCLTYSGGELSGVNLTYEVQTVDGTATSLGVGEFM